MEHCLSELLEFVRDNRKDTYNLSAFMYHTITRNLDLFRFRQMEKEFDRVKAFEVAYKATLFQIEMGQQLAQPPSPETLIESKPPEPITPETVKKTEGIRSSILSMFE